MRGTEAAPSSGRSDEGAELLVSVAARLNRISALLLSWLDVPLTFRQYRTLSRISGGYTSLSQLAQRGNLSLPTVSENVDGLVRRGLIATAKSAADRRAIVLSITDAGRDAAVAGQQAIDGFVGSLLAELSAAERQELQRLLGIIYDSATNYFEQNFSDRSSETLN